ncbi:MAG: enoyl-CoA hydratase/isomerase family protein [Sphingobium sp.]
MSRWDVTEEDGVVVAALNDPPDNYLNGEAIAQFTALIPRWRADDINAIIVTSAVQDRYLTHGSCEEILGFAQDLDAIGLGAPEIIGGVHAMVQALTMLDKPVIAAITGHAMGLGLELSLNCDLRIQKRGDYVLGFPEVSLGFMTGSGSLLLARTVGSGRAMDMMMRSRLIGPDEALAIGLVTELADDPLARARHIARRLKAMPRTAVVAAKRAIVRGGNLPIAEGLRIEADEWTRTFRAGDWVERMRAYTAEPFDARPDWIRRNGAA